MPRLSSSSSLTTRVGRRFLVLFLVSAVVPVSALAVVTWREVRAQLEQQAKAQLREEVKRLALDVVGRLQHAAREVRDIAARPTLELSAAPDAMIDAVVVLSLDGAQLVGGDRAWEPLAPGQPKLLRTGEPVLLQTEGPPRHLWMGVLASHDGQTIIAGRLRGDHLLVDAIEQTLSQTSRALVADDRGHVVYGDIEGRIWPDIPSEMTGLLSWDDDGQWLGAYFKPPLAALYGIRHWTVAVGRRQDEVYAPVRGFLWQFSLIVIFTVGVVSLLSLVQVRRQLVPLHELREGTQRLAARDFSTPIAIDSGDEFQDLAQAFDAMRSALRQSFDTLEGRSAIDRAVLSSLDTQHIAITEVSNLARIVPSTAVACIVVDDDGTATSTVWRTRDQSTSLATPRGAIRDADFAAIREWTASQRLDAPPVLQALMTEPETRVLAVPVRVDQRLAGVIALSRAEAAPFDTGERDLVEQSVQQVAVAFTNAGLVHRLERLNLGTLNALARTIDAKSSWTAGHSERVTAYGVALARALGLDEPTIAEMRRGGLLHDIGKIGIPNHILDKPGQLTHDEMAIVKRHPEVGARILEPIAEYAAAIPIVLQHHERWDGTGYPFGLRGEDISLGGRIFALADVFDALTSDRPYRRGWALDDVAALFARETGRHFDPSLTPVFLSLMPGFFGRSSGTPDVEPPRALSA
jgi:putative nucleotidyltransferase with HDIG domain